MKWCCLEVLLAYFNRCTMEQLFVLFLCITQHVGKSTWLILPIMKIGSTSYHLNMYIGFPPKLYPLFLYFMLATDPCDTAVALNNLQKRQPGYPMDATPLCDYSIKTGWYSVGSYTIPTTPPGLASCGTLYPYWTRGMVTKICVL